jgi:hypothetical protein
LTYPRAIKDLSHSMASVSGSGVLSRCQSAQRPVLVAGLA